MSGNDCRRKLREVSVVSSVEIQKNGNVKCEACVRVNFETNLTVRYVCVLLTVCEMTKLSRPNLYVNVPASEGKTVI